MEPIGTSIMDRHDPNAPAARRLDQTTSAAHAAIEKASDALRPAVDRIAGGAHHAVDRFADTATQAAHTLDARGAQLADAQARFAEGARNRVRDQPIAALGIALAAGVVVGWLIRHR
jgi:ElaB/YqjD/DUF883 family membrane-anchored ribosome-binding protein